MLDVSVIVPWAAAHIDTLRHLCIQAKMVDKFHHAFISSALLPPTRIRNIRSTHRLNPVCCCLHRVLEKKTEKDYWSLSRCNADRLGVSLCGELQVESACCFHSRKSCWNWFNSYYLYYYQSQRWPKPSKALCKVAPAVCGLLIPHDEDEMRRYRPCYCHVSCWPQRTNVHANSALHSLTERLATSSCDLVLASSPPS